MACGNTYTREQARLASRSRAALRHPTAAARQAVQNALIIGRFTSRGVFGHQPLRIFPEDKTTLDKNSDLLIWRPATAGLANKSPVGVAFAHSLDLREYNGFSLTKIRNVKFQILTGKRTAFHFVTTESIPNDIRAEIAKANEEIGIRFPGNEHLIDIHKVPSYPFAP